MIVHKNSPLQSAVLEAYSAAAENPQDQHPFPIGWEFATSLGYPYDLLAELPSVCVSAFQSSPKFPRGLPCLTWDAEQVSTR